MVNAYRFYRDILRMSLHVQLTIREMRLSQSPKIIRAKFGGDMNGFQAALGIENIKIFIK